MAILETLKAVAILGIVGNITISNSKRRCDCQGGSYTDHTDVFFRDDEGEQIDWYTTCQNCNERRD